MSSQINRKLKAKLAKAYDKYADAIFRHCYFRISNRERAKELMQETFTKTWDYMQKEQKNIDNIRAFLYRIANNLVIDEYRKDKGEKSLETLQDNGFQPSGQEEVTDQVHIKMESEKVLKIVKEINIKYREVVIMRFIDDLSPKEIAEIVGESQNNVSVRINRGLKQLREILENNEQE